MGLDLMRKRPIKPDVFGSLGEWVKWNRENERFSMRMLADELGKSHNWVARVESNEIRISREIVERIAGLTRADVSEGLRLLTDAEMGGKDVLDFLPPVEQSLIRAFRSDEVFRQMVLRMIAHQGDEQPEAVEDTRTATERKVGVPAMAETRPTVNTNPPPPQRGPRKNW